MDMIDTRIPDVKVLTPKRFGDHRGYFSETWNAARMADLGLVFDFVQDNESLSAEPGTLRGLHYQAPPFAQTKLVRCATGAILDVAVDARRGSPTYGQWAAARISAEEGNQILVPRGFLHGFVTLVPQTQVIYKVDNLYDKESDGGVDCFDPDLAIDWGITRDEATLSGKDEDLPAFRDFVSPFEYGEF
ncbi:dTDP-4-dehydrorhamnose 3,5-epimerase [Amaricoccus macauensis]|uniref:dTDP-4-dehydrorhamnose 3,5-epimerase n=1 Tax=Amaricoccus macauensis TaxID=57001 RepID=UPI003C7A5252